MWRKRGTCCVTFSKSAKDSVGREYKKIFDTSTASLSTLKPLHSLSLPILNNKGDLPLSASQLPDLGHFPMSILPPRTSVQGRLLGSGEFEGMRSKGGTEGRVLSTKLVHLPQQVIA